MELKFKKLHKDAVLPAYATEHAACMDLTSVAIQYENQPNYGYIEYMTGLSVEIPEGYIGIIRPRSSISKTGLIEATSGIIDSDYRGELVYRCKWVKDSAKFELGERFGQFYIIPKITLEPIFVDDLSTTDRGKGGHGSTGL